MQEKRSSPSCRTRCTTWFALGVLATTAVAGLPRLKVSDDHHFLVTEVGRPFFYLGDTAWELFHRLNREEAERYLRNRATAIGVFPNPGEREFTPPDPGELLDWVLVLDDAAKNYPSPGRASK